MSFIRRIFASFSRLFRREGRREGHVSLVRAGSPRGTQIPRIPGESTSLVEVYWERLSTTHAAPSQIVRHLSSYGTVDALAPAFIGRAVVLRERSRRRGTSLADL